MFKSTIIEELGTGKYGEGYKHIQRIDVGS
jgi:hypothetical protein